MNQQQEVLCTLLFVYLFSVSLFCVFENIYVRRIRIEKSEYYVGFLLDEVKDRFYN